MFAQLVQTKIGVCVHKKSYLAKLLIMNMIRVKKKGKSLNMTLHVNEYFILQFKLYVVTIFI
jgi:hypothetical protein